MSGSPWQSCAGCSHWFRVSTPGIVSCSGSGPAILQPGLILGYAPISQSSGSIISRGRAISELPEAYVDVGHGLWGLYRIPQPSPYLEWHPGFLLWLSLNGKAIRYMQVLFLSGRHCRGLAPGHIQPLSCGYPVQQALYSCGSPVIGG